MDDFELLIEYVSTRNIVHLKKQHWSQWNYDKEKKKKKLVEICVEFFILENYMRIPTPWLLE